MRLKKDHRKAFVIYFSFIVVIIIVVFPLFFSALGALEEQTVQSSSETLAYGLSLLEADLGNAYQMCQILSEDLAALNSISPTALAPSASKLVAIQNIKSSYENLFRMLALVDGVGIVLPNGVVVADGRVHMPAESYWGTFLYAQGMTSLDDWMSYIHAGAGSYAFNSLRLRRYEGNSATQYLVFSFPITMARSEGGYCYVLVREDTLLQILVQSDLRGHSSLTLSWGNRVLLSGAAQAEHTVALEAVSSGHKLNARLSIDRVFFSRQLQDFYFVGLLFLAGYFVFGLVMALLYSRHSVTPLTETVQAIRNVTQTPYLQDDYKDAYGYINQFIEEADKRLKENKLALANQELILKENLMERILRGQLFHSSPTDMVKKNFPDFPLPCVMYMVQFVDCGKLDPQQFAVLQMTARRLVEEIIPGQTLMHFTADLLILMRSSSKQADFAADLCEKLETRTDFSVRICISQPFYTADAISTVFTRLRHLLRVTDASYTVIHEDAQAGMQPSPSLQYTTRFFEALMRSQLEPALSMLNEECAVFQHTRPVSEMDVPQFFYCYRHVLYQVMTANAIPPEDIALPRYDPNASLSELLCRIRACAVEICAAQVNQRSVQTDQREQKILRAINDQLDNPDFNSDIITQQFSISSRMLQTLMRQATGTTFMDYVHAQRMERAKHLLCHTDIPIQDVGSSCGYASTNTFYKAFQRTYSITPKAMRDGGGA